jgi:hypothetical protein
LVWVLFCAGGVGIIAEAVKKKIDSILKEWVTCTGRNSKIPREAEAKKLD